MTRTQLKNLKFKLANFKKMNKLSHLFGKEEMYMNKDVKDFDESEEEKELHVTLKELKTKHDIIFENC